MIFLGELAENLGTGLDAALSLNNLFYCFVGVTLGTFLGVLPGVGALVSMSLLFPITFHLQPSEALIMLAGIYYGTTYGGSTCSILLNLPGTPSNAVACLDGYPMAQQGRAGIALFMTTIASFFGASIGILITMLFAPVIANYALRFGSPEYFSLMVLGLIAATTMSGDAAKGISSVVIGIFAGLVGTDITTGMMRFTLGVPMLTDGIGLLAVAMGLFGISQVIFSIQTTGERKFDSKQITLRSLIPSRDDMRLSWFPMLRGSGFGSFFGTLPGTGGTIAAFVSYAFEKKIAREPDRFGKGAIEGITAPESANNASDQTAFIPTLTLGIPGSASMAVILGVLIIHGIAPGPRLMSQTPELFWGLIVSFWIGNLMLLVLNIPMIGIWVRLLTIPYHLMYPAILVFISVGVYTVNQNVSDIWLVLAFGVLGYFMRLLDFPLAPLILGFVLGPMMEVNFRRALLLSRGDFMIFLTKPLSLVILILALLLLVWALWTNARQVRRSRFALGD
jgi:TctA family transporter